jgi:hypothetical protein
MTQPSIGETNPDSLSDLFSRDPLDLADADISKIVVELRRARERWSAAEASGTKSRKQVAPPTLSVDDLGI